MTKGLPSKGGAPGTQVERAPETLRGLSLWVSCHQQVLCRVDFLEKRARAGPGCRGGIDVGRGTGGQREGLVGQCQEQEQVTFAPCVILDKLTDCP